MTARDGMPPDVGVIGVKPCDTEAAGPTVGSGAGITEAAGDDKFGITEAITGEGEATTRAGVTEATMGEWLPLDVPAAIPPTSDAESAGAIVVGGNGFTGAAGEDAGTTAGFNEEIMGCELPFDVPGAKPPAGAAVVGGRGVKCATGEDAPTRAGDSTATTGDGVFLDVDTIGVGFPNWGREAGATVDKGEGVKVLDMDEAGDAVGSGKYVTASPGDKAIT